MIASSTCSGPSTCQATSSEEWDRWVRRSEAVRFAEQRGYEFVADE